MRWLTISCFMNLCFACKISGQSQAESISIENSKWVCSIAENCTNIYEFGFDSNFIFTSCEMNDIYFGKYYFSKDTLIMEQFGSVDNVESMLGAVNMSELKQYRAIVNTQELIHVDLYDWENGKWMKSTFQFDPQFTYSKIE